MPVVLASRYLQQKHGSAGSVSYRWALQVTVQWRAQPPTCLPLPHLHATVGGQRNLEAHGIAFRKATRHEQGIQPGDDGLVFTGVVVNASIWQHTWEHSPVGLRAVCCGS